MTNPPVSNDWKKGAPDFQPLEIPPGAVWRCFLALEIPETVRAAAADLMRRIRETGAHVACPRPENLHFTLAFLGDTPTETIPALLSGLDAAASEVTAFELNVRGVGFFGPPGAPRVVWAGVAGVPPQLTRLHAACRKILLELKFSIEDRPFQPHLTLARVRSRRNVADLTSWAASFRSSSLGRYGVQGVRLMRSRLDQPEARYTLVHEARLKGE